MMQEFFNANVWSMFAIGLLLACMVGIAEGFMKARDVNGVFSYRKVLYIATPIIVFYLIFGGGGLYLATRLQN